jgi:hypothetical protein
LRRSSRSRSGSEIPSRVFNMADSFGAQGLQSCPATPLAPPLRPLIAGALTVGR